MPQFYVPAIVALCLWFLIALTLCITVYPHLNHPYIRARFPYTTLLSSILFGITIFSAIIEFTHPSSRFVVRHVSALVGESLLVLRLFFIHAKSKIANQRLQRLFQMTDATDQISWERTVTRYAFAFAVVLGSIDSLCLVLLGNFTPSLLDPAIRVQYAACVLVAIILIIMNRNVGKTLRLTTEMIMNLCIFAISIPLIIVLGLFQANWAVIFGLGVSFFLATFHLAFLKVYGAITERKHPLGDIHFQGRDRPESILVSIESTTRQNMYMNGREEEVFVPKKPYKLVQFLEHPIGYKAFATHLRDVLAVETLLFLTDVSTLRFAALNEIIIGGGGGLPKRTPTKQTATSSSCNLSPIPSGTTTITSSIESTSTTFSSPPSSSSNVLPTLRHEPVPSASTRASFSAMGIAIHRVPSSTSNSPSPPPERKEKPEAMSRFATWTEDGYGDVDLVLPERVAAHLGLGSEAAVNTADFVAALVKKKTPLKLSFEFSESVGTIDRKELKDLKDICVYLCEQYVSESADDQINVSWFIREEIEEKVKQIDEITVDEMAFLFDSAVIELWMMLMYEFRHGFQKSQHFLDLVKDQEG